MAQHEAIIGLEVHAQLKTQSKMFCACSTNFGDHPNTNICPVCTGYPGTLPVVNRRAVEMAIKTGLALGCDIQRKSIFARKNYFYPDLPKGYQISQYEYPLCLGGHLDIRTPEGVKRISLIRIHLEEDAGKLLHDYGHSEQSHVDFNRCGVPLIEIVSGPDIRSPKEARNYLRTLRNALVYLDVCEGNLQEGNFRCDVNISIRPIGQKEFGTRTEMKNLNSFKAVEQALAYEIKRQQKLLEQGQEVIQETRLWNDVAGQTESMRVKEEAHDYRYFPDPDLLPLVVNDKRIDEIGGDLPELAGARSERFVSQYGIPQADAVVLTDERKIADYFEEAVKCGAPPKKAANWILSEILREIKEDERGIDACPITPANLARLIGLIEKGTISGKMAKEVFAEMYSTGKEPEAIVKGKGLAQLSDADNLEKIVDQVIASHAKQVEQYRKGKTAVATFFVGQVMKATRGQANPKLVNDLLKVLIKEIEEEARRPGTT